MNRRFAILCPGQGGQNAAMFALTAATNPLQLRPILPPAIAGELDAILSDPARLFANRFAQPLLVAVGLAQWAQLRDLIAPPAMIAGYSIGELTAYGVAGALPAVDLIAIASARALAMDACVDPDQPQTMLAISGLSYAVAEPLLQARGLFLAIKNGTDRLVAGGFRNRCVGIEAELASFGASCQRLPVEVASHTPHMQGASAPFAAALAAYRWKEFTTPVLSGIRAEKITGEMQARQTLVDQLTQPVAWDSCIDACVENGIGVTLELGPGDALSRMMRARYPEMASRSVADFRSLAAAAAWLQRQIKS